MLRISILALLGACNPHVLVGDDTATDCTECGNDTSGDDTGGGNETDPNDVDDDGDGFTENGGDCNDANDDVSPGADEVCGDGIDNDCSGSDLACDEQVEYDFVQTITAPGGSVYGSMWCHVEYVEEGTLDERIANGDWSGWDYTTMGHWVSEVTISSNPGIIDGARSNCTVCPDELAEEPSGTDAEDRGCTWTGYGQDASEARINGSVSTVYFDESFSATTVNLEGGTSVLVDLR